MIAWRHRSRSEARSAVYNRHERRFQCSNGRIIQIIRIILGFNTADECALYTTTGHGRLYVIIFMNYIYSL